MLINSLMPHSDVKRSHKDFLLVFNFHKSVIFRKKKSLYLGKFSKEMRDKVKIE